MEKTGSKHKDGTYVNQWNPWPHTFFSGALKFISWIIGLKCKAFKDWITGESEDCSSLKVYHPYFKRRECGINGIGSKLKMTWLGHASVLVEMDDIKILCDPVFSDRSPNYVGPKRFKASPCKVMDLPDDLDAVVISHNHFDHMDLTTLEKIAKKYENIKWLVPKGDKVNIDSFAKSGSIQEMEWWDEAYFNKTGKDLRVVFTPTQHWSNRGVFDRFKSLWGSYAFIGSYKVWFGGDTGYCGAFKEIGDNYGPFDLAAIPIGAYEPRELMKYQHVNPTESVEIHKDIGAKQSIGIHWGTFVLTSEGKMAPKRDLEAAVTLANLSLPENNKVKFSTLHHGETIQLLDNECFGTCNGGEQIELPSDTCVIL